MNKKSTFFTLVAMVTVASAQAANDPPPVTHDGLHLVPDTTVARAYVKPEADFSVYNRLLIGDCTVAFKKNWQKHYNRDTASLDKHVRDKDVERIKNDMSELCREVFVEVLDKKGGYTVTDAAASDVLLVRPAIIDLVVTAPDLPDAGRTHTYVASAGAATLYIELYDSVSGEILARAADRRAARDYGRLKWSTRSTNRAEARYMLANWAELLRERLDQFHGK